MSNFVKKHWRTIWQSYVASVILGTVLYVLGLSLGLFLVFVPTFLMLAAFYFKHKEVK